MKTERKRKIATKSLFEQNYIIFFAVIRFKLPVNIKEAISFSFAFEVYHICTKRPPKLSYR